MSSITYLYKYSPINENSLSGLINSQLWFSDPTTLNDPFDCQLDFDMAILENFFNVFSPLYDDTDKNNRKLIESVEDYVIFQRKTLKENSKSAGVLCLTASKNNILMWSHYADSHKGVMLEFINNDEFITSKEQKSPITYIDKYVGLKLGLRKSVKGIDACVLGDEIYRCLTTKSKVWKYEKEVRITKNLAKNSDRLVSYTPECLTGIYFGLDTSEEHKKTIKAIIKLKGLNVKLYQAEKVHGRFKIKYTELKDYADETIKPMKLNRQLYSNQSQQDAFLRLLLTHDGSTTRLCNAVNGEPVLVHLHQQDTVTAAQIPPEVITVLGGTAWLQRITSLHNAQGDVFMDNLSFTRLDAVPTWFIEALNEGSTPIGRLLDQLFVKRINTPTTAAVQNLLWNCVGMPDARASRSYHIATPEGAFMLIFEVFRNGFKQGTL